MHKTEIKEKEHITESINLELKFFNVLNSIQNYEPKISCKVQEKEEKIDMLCPANNLRLVTTVA